VTSPPYPPPLWNPAPARTASSSHRAWHRQKGHPTAPHPCAYASRASPPRSSTCASPQRNCVQRRLGVERPCVTAGRGTPPHVPLRPRPRQAAAVVRRPCQCARAKGVLTLDTQALKLVELSFPFGAADRRWRAVCRADSYPPCARSNGPNLIPRCRDRLAVRAVCNSSCPI